MKNLIILFILLFSCTKSEEVITGSKNWNCQVVVALLQDENNPGENFKPDTTINLRLEYRDHPIYTDVWITHTIFDPEEVEILDPELFCYGFKAYDGFYYKIKSCKCDEQ